MSKQSAGRAASRSGEANKSNTELPPAARRALAEAEQRRAERERAAEETPREINGRKGPDPVRFGDWEKNGIASDF